MPEAATGLIVGASFVQAKQVRDDQTMGALLERSLRDAGHKINVRQYGYDGQSVPAYVGMGPALMQKWNPSWVVVVMSSIDWSEHARLWRMDVSADGIPSATIVTTTSPATGIKRGAHLLAEKSALISAVYWWGTRTLLRTDRVASAQPAQNLSGASLHQYLGALQYVFGNRVRVLYLAEIGIAGTSDTNESLREQALLGECARLAIPCLSTRDIMQDKLRRNHIVSRGFGNTVIGEGHLNPAGHTMAALKMESLVTGH